jgi:hypothetical protein
VVVDVAALGFVPMALSTAPGSEVQRPLATVVPSALTRAHVADARMTRINARGDRRRPGFDRAPERRAPANALAY